jgi:hypothetical protein
MAGIVYNWNGAEFVVIGRIEDIDGEHVYIDLDDDL